MPSRTTTPPDHVFGFEMLDTGKCRLTLIDGTTVTFRRPKFGEFRALREALYERDKETLRLTSKANAETQQVPARGEVPDPERVEAALAAKDRQESLEWELTDLNGAWVSATLGPLAEDGELPDVDEWPPEMLTNQFIIDLVNHWRHVPLGRGGGRPNPTVATP